VWKEAAVAFPVPLGAGIGDLHPKRDLRLRIRPDYAYLTEVSAEGLTSC
jgi:hypothetical protein